MFLLAKTEVVLQMKNTKKNILKYEVLIVRLLVFFVIQVGFKDIIYGTKYIGFYKFSHCF